MPLDTWLMTEGAAGRCFSVKQDMVHSVDPKRLAPEEKKKTVKNVSYVG